VLYDVDEPRRSASASSPRYATDDSSWGGSMNGLDLLRSPFSPNSSAVYIPSICLVRRDMVRQVAPRPVWRVAVQLQALWRWAGVVRPGHIMLIRRLPAARHRVPSYPERVGFPGSVETTIIRPGSSRFDPEYGLGSQPPSWRGASRARMSGERNRGHAFRHLRRRRRPSSVS
jgi:hypothetical protein